MNESRKRKILYLLILVALFTAVFGVGRWWIQPAADRYHLTQRSMGQVDPVSGTAQLVLLGFRGVAVTLLWQEAIELKRKERWFEIRPVVESITLLQPNFIKPWEFQAWNMAFNVAAEWEAVRDKYHWIREGIEYLKEAARKNRDSSDLQWYVGWMYFQRFGFADEKTLLRHLFKNDDDLDFVMASSGIKDNFEKSYDFFSDSNATIRRLQKPPKGRGIGPHMSYAAMSKTNYPMFMEEDGQFDERTKNAWRVALSEWLKFGSEGGPDRESFMHRLEYSPREWAQLTKEQQYWVGRHRETVRYNYWKTLARIEGTDEMMGIREALFNATKARRSGDYSLAKVEYERAFPPLRKILEENTVLREDDLMREEVQEFEDFYLRVLGRLDVPLPETRPFDGIYEPLPVDLRMLANDRDRAAAAAPPLEPRSR